MPLEIERKFLLSEFPDMLIREGKLIIQSVKAIDQTYLALHEDQELRIRKIRDMNTGDIEYTHTFKQGFGLTRQETEVSISEGIYEQMMRIHDTIPLRKRRFTAEWQGTVIEIDCYDQLELTVAEVEFASEAAAEEFRPPHWFGLDISLEKQYSNKKVWTELQQSRKQ